jgi:hypothetical protein
MSVTRHTGPVRGVLEGAVDDLPDSQPNSVTQKFVFSTN